MLTFKYDFPGDYSECEFIEGMIPSGGVYEPAFLATSAFSSAAAGTVLNARAIRPDTGNARLFLGSATKIEELTSSAITDRSKSGGYSGVQGWSFSQGIAANEVVAASIGYTIQVSTGGAFSDLTNAPKALVVLAQSRALLALNYIDGATSVPNGIKISDRGSSTTWTPTTSNDAAEIKLVETPGEIYAGATLNDIVAVWKRNSMYVGRFVGGSEKWQFNLLSPYIGCYGPEAWAATPAGIVFAGPAGVYIFDGSVPREIDVGVRQVILNWINTNNRFGYDIQISHDEYSSCVFLWIPKSEGADTSFRCLAYNYRDGRWSVPYPIKDWTTGTAYDLGVVTPTGFQAVVRDLTLFDFNKINSQSANYVGHFIVAGDKKVYNLSWYVKGEGKNFACRLLSGRVKVQSPADTDLLLRRVYPIFGSGRLISAGLPGEGDVLKCVVTAYESEHYARGAPSTSKTSDFDVDRQRFDVFITGKMFQVDIYSAAGVPFSLKDIRFDIVPVGKT